MNKLSLMQKVLDEQWAQLPAVLQEHYQFLSMRLHVKAGCLYYEGQYFVLKLGRIQLLIPEWLLLGHTTIEEKALDSERFSMDFRMQHPCFGQLFRYAGVFRVDGD